MPNHFAYSAAGTEKVPASARALKPAEQNARSNEKPRVGWAIQLTWAVALLSI